MEGGTSGASPVKFALLAIQERPVKEPPQISSHSQLFKGPSQISSHTWLFKSRQLDWLITHFCD
jgi:hypothetical protein